jgi:hypothetical protein
MMKRLLILTICFALLLFGCGPKRQETLKTDISNALQPASLRYTFNTQPINLKERSQCNPADISVNIINAEKTKKDINIIPWRPFNPGWDINPYEIAGHVTAYLTDAYRQCRVPVNPNSKKTILVSIWDINGYYSFNSGITMKVIINIPEKNLTVPLSVSQSAPDMYNAVAYAIHDVSWQIINDPSIQDYILCR